MRWLHRKIMAQIKQKIEVQELQELSQNVRFALFVKATCRLFVNTDRMYIVKPNRGDEIWTYNESRAVEKYNEL